MAKPTNKDNQAGCNPVSSNCVIWQGPDIPCINLCRGDSVTDIVYRLATELCDVLDQLDLDTYDLTCFNPICPSPENFHDLIQFLINKICELEECCDSTTPTPEGCPDCVVSIAACFQYTNETGDLVTTMQLSDYVQAIGNRICQSSSQIRTVQTVVEEHETRIKSLEDNCCNDDETPEIFINSSCLLGRPPEGGWEISTVLTNLETQFCELRLATGLPSDIYLAIAKQCAGLDMAPSLSNPFSNMGSLPGWVTQANFADLSDSINNMWISICDIRAAIINIQNTCCSVSCQDINVVVSATMSDVGGILSLYFTGTIPVGFQDCNPSGNLVTITDTSLNTYSAYIPVVVNLNGPAVTIDLSTTSINTGSDLTITLTGCWQNISEGITCGQVINYTLINSVLCPSMTLIPTFDQIGFSFNNAETNPITYTVELWNSLGTALLSSQVFVNPSVGAVTGSFAGLVSSTTYKVRVKITFNGSDTYCPFGTTTTLSLPCPPPTSVSAEGEIT